MLPEISCDKHIEEHGRGNGASVCCRRCVLPLHRYFLRKVSYLLGDCLPVCSSWDCTIPGPKMTSTCHLATPGRGNGNKNLFAYNTVFATIVFPAFSTSQVLIGEKSFLLSSVMVRNF